MEFATLLPPNSHGEPTPADKDPVPDPFDNTYNVPEHDDFVIKVKYIRDDRFVVENLIDDATRARLDHAWNDLYASFEYHDNYLRLLAEHYKVDLKGKRSPTLDEAELDAMPAELRKYAQASARRVQRRDGGAGGRASRSVEDCLQVRQPRLAASSDRKGKAEPRGFYDKTITAEPDHRKAIRALLARILVSPAFLYRVEQPLETPTAAAAEPLSSWEMASRLSYFLWSSIPDDELRRAAAAGELSNPRDSATPGEAHAGRSQGPPPLHGVLRPVARLLPLRSDQGRRYQPLPRVHRRSERRPCTTRPSRSSNTSSARTGRSARSSSPITRS